LSIRFFNCLVFICICFASFGQNKIDVKAVFDIENKQIKIAQTIEYFNTTDDALSTIYLNDWNNSYSTKSTPLAIRIADEYINDFHLAKNKDRGFSVITSIKQNGEDLIYNQLKNQIDILKVELKTPLKPKTSYTIDLEYLVKIPNSKFTKYGITNDGDINLRYWYITPAIYDGEWQYYSNKNLDDLFIPKADISLEIEYPKAYYLTSELDVVNSTEKQDNQIVTLEGRNRISNKLFLNKTDEFKTIQDEELSIISNIKDKGIEVIDKVLITEKIKDYISEKFMVFRFII